LKSILSTKPSSLFAQLSVTPLQEIFSGLGRNGFHCSMKPTMKYME